MDDQQALAVVTALAHGANPQTGEIFGSESVYQSPDVIRALFVAQRALEAKVSNTRPLAKTVPEKVSSVAGSGVTGMPRALTEEEVKAQETRGENRSSNIGKPWNTEEDKRLLTAFDNDQPITEIARAHARTISGIRARLEKHGRLEPSTATRWPPKSASQKSSAPP